MKHYREILDILYAEHVTDVEDQKCARCNILRRSNLLKKKNKLKWLGHVSRSLGNEE